MGETLSVECPCGYHREFWLGVGMMNCMAFEPPLQESGPNSLGELINNRTEFAFIKSLYDEKGGRAVSWGEAVYRCPKCSHLSNRLHYRIEYNGGIYEKDYKCSKCGSVMESLGNGSYDEEKQSTPIDFSGIPCPKCSRLLVNTGQISSMWD